MTYLLSEEGRQAMRSLVAGPLLYAFDFDGTLAPISPNRHAVKLSRPIGEWLKELAKRAPCAVVSGRSLTDLSPRINGTVPYVIGNHGIESPLTPAPTLTWADGICQGWKAALRTRLADRLTELGVEVEDKRYTLTFHFRTGMDPEPSRVAVLSLIQDLRPVPVPLLGKASVNALPPARNGRFGKGPATLALMTHLGLKGLLYVGDDETDETVFALKERLVMGVRIGESTGSHARYYLKRQEEIEEVLRFLIHRLDKTPETPATTEERRGRTAGAGHDR
jgi:trehalose 6-phosphate phosphatase